MARAARKTAFLAASIVALGLGMGACKKDGANSAGAMAGGDDLSLLPADAEIVLGLNFAQLQQSALWKQFAPKVMDKAAGGLAEFKGKCGFDPMEAVKSVSIGFKNLTGKMPEGVVVVHGPDKGKVTACMNTIKPEAAKNGAEITQDGDVWMVKDKGGGATGVTFIGNDTMIAVVGSQVTKDSVLAATKGGSALKTSPTFVDMFSKIDAKQSVWLLVNGNAPFMAQAAAMGVKPKAVFGSVNITDGLSVDMRVRLATNDEAKSFVDTMKNGMASGPVKAMFDKLDIAADGPDAKFSVALSQEKLKQMVGMFGGMLGGMLGGGMGGGMGGPGMDPGAGDPGAGGAEPPAIEDQGAAAGSAQ